MKSLVGNDLIDLRAAHNRGRARQPRFVERTLTAVERDLLQYDDDGDLGFALLWSAKEAAYKATIKRDPTLVFAPRRWQVEVGPPISSCGNREGSVSMDAHTRVAVRWESGAGWLHCVALLGAPPARIDRAVAASVDQEADGEFSERERESFTCRESATARNLAKRLLRGYAGSEIEILRARSGTARLPPKVYAGATPVAGIDLSLSHDGCFVAAVICVERKTTAPTRLTSQAQGNANIQSTDHPRVPCETR